MKTLIQKVTRDAPYRTWRSAQGSEMDARFIKREGSKITLKDKQEGDCTDGDSIGSGVALNMRKYEEARAAKRPIQRPVMLFFCFTNERDSVLESGFKSMSSLGCRYGQLPLDGEGEIDLSLFLVHEKKEEGFRREPGFPPRYHNHGGWNPHYFIDRGPVRGGFGSEANCRGKEKGGFRGIDGIGYEAIR